jgi:hypothetical protein
MLVGQGQKLRWIGAGRDTFTGALAVQLRVAGQRVKGVNLAEEATVAQAEESARQLRLQLLRYVASNQHLLQGVEGPEQLLQAAALCFRVDISCGEVTLYRWKNVLAAENRTSRHWSLLWSFLKRALTAEGFWPALGRYKRAER